MAPIITEGCQAMSEKLAAKMFSSSNYLKADLVSSRSSSSCILPHEYPTLRALSTHLQGHDVSADDSHVPRQFSCVEAMGDLRSVYENSMLPLSTYWN